MKTCIFVVTMAVLTFFCALAFAAQQPEDVLDAIMKVRTTVPESARTARILGVEREGSGVVIDSDGHVLTIGYLILEAETVEIQLPDGEVVEASYVGYDHDSGLGVIKARRRLEVRPMEFGSSSEVKVGDPLLVVSHGGPDAVVGARVVSRQEFAGSWEYLLEDAIFTAPPHPNFGGAALIGPQGRLVGVGSLYTRTAISGVGQVPSNMFVPIDDLKPILADLIKRGRSSKPPRPWLGLNTEAVLGHVFVTRVSSGAPAEKEGLQPGDIILTVNKEAIDGVADFYRKVWALGRAGVRVPLEVLQGIRIKEITIKSIERHQYLNRRPR